jgi:peptidoglycan/LPS O-acetylase OafA/YrhL
LQRIKELDGLRAIAILGVLICHFARQYHGLYMLKLGWAGVDLFFGISGFLITGILIGLRGGRSPYKTFYWRRALRIFPPYYAALALLLLLAFIHKEHVQYMDSVRYGLFLASTKFTLIKATFYRLFFHRTTLLFAPSIGGKYYVPEFRNYLSIYWSLSVEELFYLVWAPVILRGSRNSILIFSIMPLLICPILRGIAHTPTFGESYGFVFRFDALAAGGCVALLFYAMEHGQLRAQLLDRGLSVGAACSFAGLVFLAWRCGVFREVDVRFTRVFSVFGFTLLAIFCASLVGVCARSRTHWSMLSRALQLRPLVYLGTIGYTMYLVHMIVYVFLQLVVLRLLSESNVLVLDTNPWLLVLLGVLTALCTITLAHFSWRYLETPILRLKDRRFPSRFRPQPIQLVAEVAAS